MDDAVLDPADLEAIVAKLTPRRLRFCLEYVVDLNGAQAAIRAGYAEVSSRVEASRLLADDNIRRYIDHLRALRASRLSLDADWVLRRYMQIASSKAAEFYEVDDRGNVRLKDFENWPDPAAVKQIKTHSLGEAGEIIEVQFHDPMKALDAVAKHLGLFKDRVDVTSGDEPLKAPTVIRIGHRIEADEEEPVANAD